MSLDFMYQSIVSKFRDIIFNLLPLKSGDKALDEKSVLVMKILLKQPLNAPYYSLELLALLVDSFNEMKLYKISGSVLNLMAEMISDLKVGLIGIINQSLLNGMLSCSLII